MFIPILIDHIMTLFWTMPFIAADGMLNDRILPYP